jgi:hypothetical protein
VPTPVGPLGPDEIDPDDPDLWDWEASDDDSPPRQPRWVRITAWSIATIFAVLVIFSFFR